MPIRELQADGIKQECIPCGDTHDVPFTAFFVGVKREGQISGNLMQLPPCPVCGAVEFLVVSADGEPQHPSLGSYGHKHRLLVDRLHGQMLRAGRLLKELDATTLPIRDPSDEAIQRWFPNGLELQRPNDHDQRVGAPLSEVSKE